MESKTICQRCTSAADSVVRRVISGCRRIKESIWKFFTGRPSRLPNRPTRPKIEIEEPEFVEESPVESVAPEKPLEEKNED